MTYERNTADKTGQNKNKIIIIAIVIVTGIIIVIVIIGPTVCVFGSTTMCLRKDYYVFARTSIIICISISIICIWNIICICNMNTSGGQCYSITTAELL